MAETLRTRSEPWGYDPTCTKITHEIPGGEVVWTEITRPKKDVDEELARRAARRAKRAAFVKADPVMPYRLDSLLSTRLARPLVSGAAAVLFILLIVNLWPL